MLKEINLLLKEYFFQELEQPSDTVLDFSFELPSKDWLKNNNSSENWINIYLLEVKENLELRQNSWQRETTSLSSEKKKSPLFIDLFYLITFYNKDKKTDLELNYLEKTLITLYDFKNLAFLNNNLDADLINKINLELFPKPFIDENISYQLWNSLDQDARPYLPLKITVPLESKINKTESVVAEEGRRITIEQKTLQEVSENK